MAKQFKTNIEVQRVTGLDLPSDPLDAASKEYVDSVAGTGGSGSFLPFWTADGNQNCIALNTAYLPFWLSDGTQSNINLGC